MTGRGMPRVVDVSGHVSDGRLPLDVEEVLRHLPDDGDLTRPLPAGTKIGHVHLHVKDFPSARAFYGDVLGFQLELDADTIGMIDFSAGGSFPHVMAMNTWQGVGAPPAPAGTAGLRSFTIRAADRVALGAILDRARAAGHAVELTSAGAVIEDPSGHRIVLLSDAGVAPLPGDGAAA
jgi:catechol 2,3-dioxygenase